jgi:hypothetical protein
VLYNLLIFKAKALQDIYKWFLFSALFKTNLKSRITMWHYFQGQYMPSYQVNRALTQAHYGGGEFAEVLEVASQITPGDNESFHQAWAKWVIMYLI